MSAIVHPTTRFLSPIPSFLTVRLYQRSFYLVFTIPSAFLSILKPAIFGSPILVTPNGKKCQLAKNQARISAGSSWKVALVSIRKQNAIPPTPSTSQSLNTVTMANNDASWEDSWFGLKPSHFFKISISLLICSPVIFRHFQLITLPTAVRPTPPSRCRLPSTSHHLEWLGRIFCFPPPISYIDCFNTYQHLLLLLVHLRSQVQCHWHHQWARQLVSVRFRHRLHLRPFLLFLGHHLAIRGV